MQKFRAKGATQEFFLAERAREYFAVKALASALFCIKNAVASAARLQAEAFQ